MHSGSEGCAESNAWQAMLLLLMWKQSDTFRFISHRDDVLIIHHETGSRIAPQVDVDEEVIVARTKQTCRGKRLDIKKTDT